MKLRDLCVAGVIAVVLAGVLALPPFDWMRGLSLDVSFWLRHQVLGARHRPAESPAVVVAIDEETYRRAPFKDLPKVMWTKQIARVMDAVIEGGAKVVGFDVIFPTSVERYLRGFDREFLVALRNASRSGKVVLAKVQHQVKPISPFAGYSFAVGHKKNIRPTNLFEDDDSLIRRVPLWLRSSDLKTGVRIEPTLALEIAARALGVAPRIGADGGVRLDDYSVPGWRDGGMLINFDGGVGTIPTCSLADLYSCIERGRIDYFRRHFAGKAVLIGAVLDVEDRKLTSKRFITGHEGVGLPDRCVHPVMQGFYRADIRRDTIPGVYLLAAAVNSLIRKDALVEFGRGIDGLVVFALITGVAVAVLLLPFWVAVLAVIGGAVVWTGAVTAGLASGLVLPLLHPLVGTVLAFAAMSGYRFAVAEKDKRYLRQAFALYLPPTEIDRVVERAEPPALGGETRELTVLFSDIEAFTTISEQLSPQELVGFLNRYLSEVTDIVEAHGGFIDKYIGDAVVAVFGAPLADPEHALHAVGAALVCQRRLAHMSKDFGLATDLAVRTRIGVNTGEMLIGNIGSRRRFNYTVMGDAVNLASRLEGANKQYGTATLVSDATARHCGDRIVFREVDKVRVVGRDTPVTLFEPVGAPETVDAEKQDALMIFAQGLMHYRARNFAEAASVFAEIAARDPVARHYLDCAHHLQVASPDEDWDGVTVFNEK